MSDRIRIRGLRVVGFHGVLPSERAEGQQFLVDLDLRLPLADAGARDDLGATVDYGTLADAVAGAVRRDPVDLIETVAERVAAVALEHPLVQSVRVTVHKPDAPIATPFADVSVTIERARG